MAQTESADGDSQTHIVLCELAILKEEFSDLVRRPGNQYASLVTILNRLVEYGKADTFLPNGSRFWQR